jgi:hypothetical protein
LRVGRVIERFHMGKHIELSITDTAFTWQRRHDSIAQEAALDGLCVIRTSVSAQQLDVAAAVAAYKSLSNVERAFRSMKTVDLLSKFGVNTPPAKPGALGCEPLEAAGRGR